MFYSTSVLHLSEKELEKEVQFFYLFFSYYGDIFFGGNLMLSRVTAEIGSL